MEMEIEMEIQNVDKNGGGIARGGRRGEGEEEERKGTVHEMFDSILDSDIKQTRNQAIHPRMNAETKPLQRINKMFKPLAASSQHLRPFDAAMLNRTNPQCHHHHHHHHYNSNGHGGMCNCARTINRNKHMRTYHFRQNKREQSIQSNRGDIMGFVFEREQLRDDSRLEKASKTSHEAFVHELLDDCDHDLEYDADCDDDENFPSKNQGRHLKNTTCMTYNSNISAFDREDMDQYELEQFIIQDQLEMESLMDNLTLGI